MTGEGETIEGIAPPPTTTTKPESPIPTENPSTGLLDIVKRRLAGIAEQLKKQDIQELANTAQVLLEILNGSINPMASLTTTLKPIQEQPAPTTDGEELPSPEGPQPEEPQPQTYNNIRIVEGGIVVATDSQGRDVRFSFLELVVDMARTVGLPEHYIEVIKAQVERAQLNRDQEESLARRFGFFTQKFLCELFDIPTDKEERQKALNNPDIPDPVKELIRAIDTLPTLPDAKDVCQVLSKAKLPITEPLSGVIGKLRKFTSQLPDKEQQKLLQTFINQIEEQIAKESGAVNQTLADLITNYYQQLNAGEDVEVNLPELIALLADVRSWQQQESQQKKQQIIENVENKIGKWGKAGKIGLALTLLSFWVMFMQILGEKT